MKTITWKKTSLFYRLATVYGPMWSHLPCGDLCFYTRAVAMGVLGVLSRIALFSFAVVITLGGLIPWVAFMLMHGLVEIGPLATVNAILDGVFSILALMIYGGYLMNQHGLNVEIKPPSFVKEAYRSFKDKTCVRVEFTND